MNQAWGQCCHRWWRGKSLILLFCFIYSDNFDYYFHFLPPYSQYPLLFPFQFSFFFGVWGNCAVCKKGKELAAVRFVSKMFCESKETTTFPFTYYQFFSRSPNLLDFCVPVTGASGPPRWSSVWHLHSESVWNWGPPTAPFGINDHPNTGCCEMAVGRIYCLEPCMCGSCQVHILAPG